VRAYVALGANLGNPDATLRAAFAALAGLPHSRLAAHSSLYDTSPVDADGPDYRNAVAALDTRLEAAELMQALQRIENAHGRERPYPHAPRTLDLDLLLYGNLEMQGTELTIPHPRMHLRAFVLAPLLEIAPAIAIPRHGAARNLLAQITDQPIRKLP
jgi:2-amino-4-hydroxy-6-hydroxymethyldihydropteridine diphosphokinase